MSLDGNGEEFSGGFPPPIGELGSDMPVMFFFRFFVVFFTLLCLFCGLRVIDKCFLLIFLGFVFADYSPDLGVFSKLNIINKLC